MIDIPEGQLDVPYCERCDGLAVIDYGHIRFIPTLLNRAIFLLGKGKFENSEDEKEALAVEQSLRIYRDLIETMAVE